MNSIKLCGCIFRGFNFFNRISSSELWTLTSKSESIFTFCIRWVWWMKSNKCFMFKIVYQFLLFLNLFSIRIDQVCLLYHLLLSFTKYFQSFNFLLFKFFSFSFPNFNVSIILLNFVEQSIIFFFHSWKFWEIYLNGLWATIYCCSIIFLLVFTMFL